MTLPHLLILVSTDEVWQQKVAAQLQDSHPHLSRWGSYVCQGMLPDEALAKANDATANLVLLDVRQETLAMAVAFVANTALPVVALVTGNEAALETAVLAAGAADSLPLHHATPALLRRIAHQVITQATPHTPTPPTHQLIIVFDIPTQTIQYTNQTTFLGHGVTSKNLTELLHAWVHPDDQAHVLAAWRAMLNGRNLHTPIDFQAKNSSGQWQWLQVWSTLLETAGDGQPVKTLISCTHITASKQTDAILQQLTERLQIVHEIDRAILTAKNPQNIGRAALPLIRSLLRAARASITIFNFDTQTAKIMAVDGVNAESDLGLSIPFKAFRVPKSETNDQPIVIHDTANASLSDRMLRKLNQQGIRSTIAVPLITHQKAIGEINVGFATPNAFTENDVTLLKETAVPLAIALQQAQLLTQAQQQATDLHQREQYLLKLSNLTQTALSTLDLPDMMQSLTTQLADLFAADGCHITSWDAANQQSIPLAASGPYRTAFFNIEVKPNERTLTQSILEQEKVLAVENTHTTPYSSKTLAQRFADPHAILGLPLIAGGEKLGAALLIFNQKRTFSKTETAWAQQAAGQIALVIAKARLLKVEQQQRSLAETLREVFSALNQTLEPEVLFNIILDQLQRIIAYDSASVMLLRGSQLQHMARKSIHHQNNPDGKPASLRQVNYHELRHIEAVIDDQQPIIINDTLNDDRWLKLSSTPRIRSWMGVPLVMQGKTLGLINLSSQQPRFFTEEDAGRVHMLASQAAVALANSQLLTEMQHQIVNLQLLHNVARACTQTLSENDLISEVTQIIRDQRYPEHIGVLLYDPDTQLLWPHASYHFSAPTPPEETRPFPANRGIASQVLQTGQPQIVPDVRKADNYFAIESTTIAEICVPLTISGRIIGIINAESSQPAAFDQNDLRLLVTIAGQLATAIERTRLFAAEHARRLEAEQLREATTTLTTSLDLHTVLNNILVQIRQVLPYDSACILLQQGNIVRVVAGHGFPNTEKVLNQSYPVNDNLIRTLHQSKRPLLIHDAQTHPDFSNWGDTSYVHGWIGVPLIFRDTIIGYLTIDSRQRNAYTEADANLTFAFANHAAAAIENARLFHTTEQHAHNLQLISDVLRDLNSTPAVTDTFPHLALALKAFTGCDLVTALLITKQEDEGLLLDLSVPINNLKEGTLVALSDTAVIPDIHAHHLHQTPDLATERTYPYAASLYEQGMRSRLTIPLIGSNRPIGALNLAWTTTAGYTKSQIPTLTQVAQAIALGLERSTLFDEISHRAHQLAILHNLGRKMAGLLNTRTLAQEVVDALHSQFHYTNAAIFSINHDAQQVVLEAISSSYPQDLKPYQLQFGEGLVGQVALQQKRIVVNNTRTNESFIPLPEMEILSEIVLPLRQQKQLVGILAVQSDQLNTFAHSDTAVLNILADQLAVVMEKTHLFAEIQQRTHELESIASFSAALREMGAISEMAPTLLENIVTISKASAGYLLLRDTEDSTRATVRGQYPAILPLNNQSVDLNEGCFATAFVTGNLHICTACDPNPICNAINNYLPADSTANFISLPLRTQERIIGIVLLGITTTRPLAEQNLSLLTAVADIAGSAIDRAIVLETLEDRVEARTLELERANSRLQELDTLKSKFVSDVSHELRTPITNLNLYLDLLEKGSNDRHDFYMSVVRKQVSRLQQLLSDILDLSRLEIGTSRLEMTAVSLNSIIDPIVAAYQPSLLASGLDLKFDLAENLPQVWGERNQLSQVITNLISNSINYTPKGSIKISTFLDTERQQAALQIADTGIGISPEDRQHLFDRFYRGQRVSQLNIPGTGLGLAIVQEIVSIHNGTIDLESSPGKGATFTVWLPLANGRIPPNAASNQS